MTDLVSIIIPAYNAERFIARTLASALNQTFKDTEVIVVDDGSTDNTRHIVEAFAAGDRRLRLFSTTNRGVAMARNFGIENARGNYVAFLDADDLWHPTKIERQVETLGAHVSDSTWGGVYVFHRTINEEDQVTGGGRAIMDCRGYLLARNFVLKFIGNGSSLLVRRDAALAVGGFDPSYAKVGLGGCEDLDFELKLAASYRIEAVRSFLVGYRVYKGNMSSNGGRMAKAMVETIARHSERNPFLSTRVKRWGVGSGHRYAFQVLLRERLFLPAMRAYGMILRNDPILSIIAAIEVLLGVWERLAGFRASGAAQLFLSTDPDAGIDAPISRLARNRQKRLAVDDRTFEEKELLSRCREQPLSDYNQAKSSL